MNCSKNCAAVDLVNGAMICIHLHRLHMEPICSVQIWKKRT